MNMGTFYVGKCFVRESPTIFFRKKNVENNNVLSFIFLQILIVGDSRTKYYPIRY